MEAKQDPQLIEACERYASALDRVRSVIRVDRAYGNSVAFPHIHVELKASKWVDEGAPGLIMPEFKREGGRWVFVELHHWPAD